MNTKSVTISFYGLCAFVSRAGRIEVFLHPGSTAMSPSCDESRPDEGHTHATSGEAHEASVVVDINMVSLDVEHAWAPDSILTLPNGKQAGLWKIPGGTLAMADGKMSDESEPTQRTQGDSLSLPALHKDLQSSTMNPLHAMRAVPGLSVMLLTGGTLTPSGDTRGLRAVGKGAQAELSTATARSWSAETNGLDLASTQGRIWLRPSATAIVTNVARVLDPKGLDHFHHYYELLRPQVGSENQFRLVPNKVNRDETVYDCVPPADLP